MDRWNQIDDLFHRVSELPVEERAAFLDRACAGDALLRQELESLFAEDSASGAPFMQTPAIDQAARGLSKEVLSRGQRIRAYRILSLTGKGGMGEVYRARDPRLGRDVAIKMLPDRFSLDPDRVARFDQEARLLASLNHPNIATIHGIEEADGRKFLVMELIEGETLAERLSRGPLSVHQALTLALQIAEALESAHEKGVIHRDLKPDNIKITPEDRIKVLDFGLAKALVGAAGLQTSSHQTQKGLLLGTAAYMAPEQAKGENVDRRADIWSFGCVLYEMLTGTSPFGRETVAETLVQVLEGEADAGVFPVETPSSITRLIARCLEKNFRERLQHIGDARVEIRDALAEAASGIGIQRWRSRTAKSWSRWTYAIGLTGLLGFGMLLGAFITARLNSGSPSRPSRLYLPSPEAPFSEPFGIRRLAISKDGTRVVYAGASGLWIRPLDQNDATSLKSPPSSNPFFSPDGAWVAFFQGGGSGGALSKVPADGGPVRPIASLSGGRPLGGDWHGKQIVFAASQGLFLVAEDGGQPHLLIAPDPERQEKLFAWPQFLPDGKSVLFSIVPEGSIEGAQIALLDLQMPAAPRIILRGGTAARYLPTGHLVFASGQVLKAVRFNPRTGVILGDAVALPHVRVDFRDYSGSADFTVSETGTLVFLPPGNSQLRIVVVVDPQGNAQTVIDEPGNYAYARLSPDRSRLALNILRGGERRIWIWDIGHRQMTPLTQGSLEDFLPEWNPEGTRVYFASDRNGKIGVYSVPADGSAPERPEFDSPGFEAPGMFTPDNLGILTFQAFGDANPGDVFLRELADPGKSKPVLNSRFRESLASLSPDGKWILYQSNELAGQDEIFLRPYPETSLNRIKVSANGGIHPRWAADGSEIYYRDLSGTMFALRVLALSPELRLDFPGKALFTDSPYPAVSGWSYDLWQGRGFLTTRPAAAGGRVRAVDVSVVQHWFNELNRLVP